MSASVVPARAGMSPTPSRGAVVLRRGPRASGDEPTDIAHLARLVMWSPRERG